MLSNIYLHEVLDGWFEQAIKPGLSGKAELIRFADDFVVVCEKREDAEALLEQVAARFESCGLTMHPEKTRIVDFRHPWKGKCKPQTFDFPGFTHYWGKTRSGGYAVTRKTKRKKFRAALANIAEWCKQHRHEPMEQQHRKLSEKVRGHMACYGIRGNYPALARFRHEAQRLWHHWLQRRSRERTGGDGLWTLLDERFRLPLARLVHAATSRQLERAEPEEAKGGLKDLGPVRVEVVPAATPTARRWAEYVERHHYLGLHVGGENVRYLAQDAQGRDLACVLFGAAAWRCAPRDRHLGLTEAQRREGLPMVANNTRFLILPRVVTQSVSCLFGSS